MSSAPHIIEAVLNFSLSLKPKTVLDVGCGYGKWGFLLWLHLFENRSNVLIVGVDVNKENLKLAKRLGVYNDLILADAAKLPFRSNIFDLALICEVIEHLGSKHLGFRLIREVEKTVRKRVIVTTPRSYEAFSGSPDHLTRWEISELKMLGYKVRGVGLSIFKQKGKLASLVRHFLLKPLSYVLPHISDYMICVKNLQESNR